jgi:phosphate starvation-inducible PhoH-like protein
MTMLLTRIGEGSKLVVTGDLDQSDLGDDNGLAFIVNKLSNYDLKHCEMVNLTYEDVQRSPAMKEVLKVITR